MEGTPPDMAPGDEAPPGNANAAPNVCARCGGTGRVDGDRCEECGGTGETIEVVGGG
jgi:DnaJ-class molecular chaperone